jgi:AcrR family transcriptional regulator
MLTPPANTREKLMRAAMDIVAADGFPAATTASIAERVGMAEGTLYRHFKSKDELLIETYRRLKAEVFEAIQARTQTATGLKGRFRALWLGMYATYAADMNAFAFGQRFGESALSKTEGGTAHERLMGHMKQLIRDGQTDGLIKPAAPEVLTAFFFPPLISMLKQCAQGRVWAEAEIELAIESAWASWAV